MHATITFSDDSETLLTPAQARELAHALRAGAKFAIRQDTADILLRVAEDLERA